MYLAFYKSNQPNADKFDKIISFFTASKYSHVELVYSLNEQTRTGDCVSSTIRSEGVRYKRIHLRADRWDILKIDTNKTTDQVREFFDSEIGKKYDFWGVIGVVIPFIKQKNSRWFCSEIVAAFLDIDNPSSLSPGDLYKIYSSK